MTSMFRSAVTTVNTPAPTAPWVTVVQRNISRTLYLYCHPRACNANMYVCRVWTLTTGTVIHKHLSS